MTKEQKDRRIAYRTSRLVKSGYHWSLHHYSGFPPETVLVRDGSDYSYALDAILSMNKYAFRSLLGK